MHFFFFFYIYLDFLLYLRQFASVKATDFFNLRSDKKNIEKSRATPKD